MSSPLVQTLASTKPVQKYLQRLTNQTVTKGNVDDNAILEIVRLQSAHLPGYNNALSSSLRDGPIRGQRASFESPAFEGKRVLVLHGTKDATVHPKYAAQIIALLPPSVRRKLVTVGHDGFSK
ncbi:hypothetical protein BJ912DRAFT_358833 [Pholiota molesta]|nr:hypothetical protein BJ912DRAFT_358833 [Pholiota molesta]